MKLGFMRGNAFRVCLLSGIGLMACSASAASEFLEPFRVQADNKPIDVEIGHAAPLLVDFDGDKVKDLLVGQFGDGKLRIYKNKGTSSEPRFDSFAWFKVGSGDGKVPAG